MKGILPWCMDFRAVRRNTFLFERVQFIPSLLYDFVKFHSFIHSPLEILVLKAGLRRLSINPRKIIEVFRLNNLRLIIIYENWGCVNCGKCPGVKMIS